jgi:hypothetical protein
MSDIPEPISEPPEKTKAVEKNRHSRQEIQEQVTQDRRLSSEERQVRHLKNEVQDDVSQSPVTQAETQLRVARRSDSLHHKNGGTTLDEIDTYLDEKRAIKMAEQQFSHKQVEELPDHNLKGVVYEGMTARHLEGKHGAENVDSHPADLHLKDGRPIKPDFVVKDGQGRGVEVVDSKAYTRKDAHNPEASAASLTHMQALDKAGRYKDADNPDLKQVTFVMPAETAGLAKVQEGVAQLGTENVAVKVESFGSEADIKQRAQDLRTPPGERYIPAEQTFQEIRRIQTLPVEQRRDAVAYLVESLKDKNGDATSELRNLGWHTRVERNGDGVTFFNPQEAGKEYTIWYK